jgi:hypothetical protein
MNAMATEVSNHWRRLQTSLTPLDMLKTKKYKKRLEVSLELSCPTAESHGQTP